MVKFINAIDFIVLNLGHARTIHPWGNKDISSPFIRIYYVKSGRAILHLPQGDMEATGGHMYLIPSYIPHSYECDPGFDFYYLFVYQRSLQESPFDKYHFPTEVRSNEAARLLFENYCMLYPQLHLPTSNAEAFDRHPAYRDYAIAYTQMEDYKRMQLHGLVEIIFSYFMKHAEPQTIISDERISRLLNYIQQHIEEPITIEQMAHQACLTKSYLIRAFHSSIGITPLQYVTRKKIQQTQMQLLSSDLSINQIAKSIGFHDTSYFIRLFKKHIGFTPEEYRKKLIG